MKKHIHKIAAVEEGSIAWELGIEPGDRLLSIDGHEIEDIFDYQFYVEEEELLLLIEKPDGEEWELEIEKDPDEQLGIEFEQGLMDEYRSCRNKCIFCFIDQMPPGMRDTLYFKDDDSRLSFLQGNYITLTNMSDRDVERIVRYRLEPINISFHTTNPELRCRMLHNRFAGDALKKVDILYQGGIEMNGQIVLCRGINDGEELERSIRKKFYQEYGLHFIHAGDEWYLLAEEELPEEERYDGYLQLENGVGMLRLLLNEFEDVYQSLDGGDKKEVVSIATGKLAYPYLARMARRIEEKYPGICIHVYCIRNEFFGERITVSGLITGQDIISQLKGQRLGSRLLIPCSMMKADEDVFLDDYTVKELSEALQVRVDIVKSSGQDLIDSILND